MTDTAPAPAPATARRTGRWLKIALVASLAINLLIIGAACAAAWRFRHMPPPPPGLQGTLLGFAGTLPPGRRLELWQATRDERQAMEPLRAEIRSAMVSLRSALVAEPFDREQFAKAQARVLEAETKARTEAQKLFLNIASQLTRDEREKFAKATERGRGNRPRSWWRRHHDEHQDENEKR